MRAIRQRLLFQIHQQQYAVAASFQALISCLNSTNDLQNGVLGDTFLQLAKDLILSYYILDELLKDCRTMVDDGKPVQDGPLMIAIPDWCTSLIVIDKHEIDDVHLALLRQAHSLVLGIKDRSARIQWLNPSFAALANRPRGELVRHRSNDIWKDEFGTQIVAHDLVAQKARHVVVFEEFLQVGTTLRQQFAIRFPLVKHKGRVLRTGVIAFWIADLPIANFVM